MVFSVLSAILSSDQDGLVGICLQHVPVGSHSNSKDMRLALVMPLTNRQQFGLEGVDWDSLVSWLHQMQTISRWVTLSPSPPTAALRSHGRLVDMGWDLNTYCTDSEL